MSDENQPGLILLDVQCPVLCFWNPDNTANQSARWIAEHSLPNLTFSGLCHWPMVDDAAQTAAAIRSFFKPDWISAGNENDTIELKLQGSQTR